MVVAAILASVNHNQREDVNHPKDLVEPMPAEDEVVFSGIVKKCPFADAGANWRPMYCSLTSENVYLAKRASDATCIDRIPLTDVTSVTAKPYPEAGVYVFELSTVEGGRNAGRKYDFRVDSPEICGQWMGVLRLTKEQNNEKHRLTSLQRIKYEGRRLHDSARFQQTFGSIIVANFIISLVQAEMVPEEGSTTDHIFGVLDLCFTGLFTIELVITFVAFAGITFFLDAWRIFDTAIVVMSLVSASGAELPAVKSIRAVRVLRAVRLLKKSKSLKPIVHALFSSVMPVMNSMSLLGLITAIYSSMAVGLFGPEDPVHFGTLSRALFTMFQASTGDGWSVIVRGLFGEDGIVKPGPALFFVSYMLSASLVLINIIIAVLLDEFLTTMAKSRGQIKQEEALVDHEGHPFDPLMAVLCKYKSLSDLLESIHLIYGRLDESGDGTLDINELIQGLPRVIPGIVVTTEDWYTLNDTGGNDGKQEAGEAESGSEARSTGEDLTLRESDFEKWCLRELKAYLLRESNKALAGGEDCNYSSLMMLKWLMVSMESLDAKSSQAQTLAPTPKQQLDLFQAADKDKSGALDLLEFASMECHEGQTLGSIKAVFDLLDSDGDGTLSMAEFAAYQAAGEGSSAAPGTPSGVSAGSRIRKILSSNIFPDADSLAPKNAGRASSEEGQDSAASADGAGFTNRSALRAARKPDAGSDNGNPHDGSESGMSSELSVALLNVNISRLESSMSQQMATLQESVAEITRLLKNSTSPPAIHMSPNDGGAGAGGANAFGSSRGPGQGGRAGWQDSWHVSGHLGHLKP